MGSAKTIVWFRRDLRIEDNPALAAADRDGSVFPVYVWCPKEEGQFYPGRVLRWWLKQSLAHLDQSLKSLGAELVLIETQSTLAALLVCIQAIGATKVVFNHLYGMRELWATGWIQNRIRVIVSSFTVKVLLLPWRWGMKYFWDTLMDADLESDILGWQYISGSLPDGHELEHLDSPEVQGSKFDPEGEYVRHWLPELARLPTEWIHHPWESPDSVLKFSGVEFGFNYSKPIIELDLARERFTKAIFKMWDMEAAAKAASANGTDEVVVDNSASEDLPIPKVILKKTSPCPTDSYNDQKVLTRQNSKSNQCNRKRSKFMQDESPLPDNRHNPKKVGPSRTNEGVSSTAKSSMSKKQTNSRNSFSVPQSYSASEGNPFMECESSEMQQSWQEQINMEQTSRKNGAVEDEGL